MYAARRLARTETTRAFGQGTIEAAKRARFVTKIGWRTSGRHDPKIDHGVCAANQQRGPYAPDDVPRYPAHPNCRCVLLPIPEDPMKIAEKLRRDLDRDNARIDPFNPPQAVLKQEAAIRPQKFESAAVFDQAGRRTLFKDGTTSAVHFTDAEMALMKNAVLTHNHPGGWNYPADDVRRMGNSLGRADVSLAVEADLAAIRAVSPTADYTLARPEGGWGMTGKQAQAQMQGAFDEVRVEFNEAIRNGEITYKQAEAYNNHEALSRVAERNGWRYERRMIE